MRIGIAADQAGLALEERLINALRKSRYEVLAFGPSSLTPKDDYPDYIVPMARGVVSGEVDRGVAICGSGVGAWRHRQ
jgi:ribose 5-phosphate isomerase B